MSVNKVSLLGRLVKDPEQKITSTGKAYTKVTLAVDRPYKVKDEERQSVDFVPVVIWGKVGEAVFRYCKKGQRLYADGRLQVRSFETKTGERRWVTEVVANRVEFIERRNENSETKTEGTSAFSNMGEKIPF